MEWLVTNQRHNQKMSEKTEDILPDTERMPRGFIHYYVYNCVASTETRGSGQIKGTKGTKKATPCGWANLRKSKFPIESHHTPQGVKCPNCGNRPRLNAGMVDQDLSFVQEPRYSVNAYGERYLHHDPRISRKDSTVPDVKARKAWAENEQNRRNRIHLGRRSKAIEDAKRTNEDSLESFEQGGVLIE